MSWVAVAIGGSALLGAAVSSNASNNAISAQKDAAKSANKTQLYMFEQQRKDLEPWREAGVGAIDSLKANNFMENWQQDPGYDFRMKEGAKALEMSAAARGGLNTGRTLKDLTRFGQDYGSQEYGNVYNREFNRLSSLAGFGNNANQGLQQASMNYGNNLANTQLGLGNAIGAANIAQSNQMTNLLGQGVTAYSLYKGGK
jgi:hypothetical protein